MVKIAVHYLSILYDVKSCKRRYWWPIARNAHIDVCQLNMIEEMWEMKCTYRPSLQ
jgi:hypothetical protein